MGKFYDYFKSYDKFGSNMALNYKGEDSFNTCLGAFFSIILKIFILIFAFYSFIEVWAFEDPQITQVSNTLLLLSK